jgi:hypothetical protein
MQGATYHVPTDQLRAEFSARLSAEDYATITAAGFRWHRSRGAFVATWTPAREDVLYQLGIEAIELDDEPEDAAGRIERYSELAGNATTRSNAAHDRAHAAVDGIPPGQPILVGHHSERHHRGALRRHDSAMRAAVDEYSKAEYWRQRAAGAAWRQRQRQDPGVIYRRIEQLEADRRRISRRHDKEPNTYDQRWLAHLDMRLAYERGQYEAAGGIPANELAIEVGGAVKTRNGWAEVVKVNRKTVTIHAYGLTYKVDISKITKSMSAAEYRALAGKESSAPEPEPEPTHNPTDDQPRAGGNVAPHADGDAGEREPTEDSDCARQSEPRRDDTETLSHPRSASQPRLNLTTTALRCTVCWHELHYRAEWLGDPCPHRDCTGTLVAVERSAEDTRTSLPQQLSLMPGLDGQASMFAAGGPELATGDSADDPGPVASSGFRFYYGTTRVG